MSGADLVAFRGVAGVGGQPRALGSNCRHREALLAPNSMAGKVSEGAKAQASPLVAHASAMARHREGGMAVSHWAPLGTHVGSFFIIAFRVIQLGHEQIGFL